MAASPPSKAFPCRRARWTARARSLELSVTAATVVPAPPPPVTRGTLPEAGATAVGVPELVSRLSRFSSDIQILASDLFRRHVSDGAKSRTRAGEMLLYVEGRRGPLRSRYWFGRELG